SIYLFDRASGRLVRRIGDLPNVVHHLAFSPNGLRLAAALGGANGIRLFRVRDGQELAQDADYGSRSSWVDFDPQGRLASTSYDGFLRLYDSELSLLAKVEAPGGERPHGIRFSPDGQRLAVGYEDTTGVDVLSGSDLSLLYSPEIGDVSNGNLGRVAWSADGQFLYAAGRYDDGTGNKPIRRWSDAGKGPYRDLPGASNTIMDLAPLQDGSLVFGAADPAWGIVNADGEHRVFLGPRIANFIDNREGFLLDATGRVVRFGYRFGGESPATFSLTGRELTPDPPDDERLRSPRTEAPGLSVESWRS
ncbi:MAG: WD40 repeat domain-containing protein, partial [bacterium]|nr:WD40 repeat domain-containing protein [bacterium]